MLALFSQLRQLISKASRQGFTHLFSANFFTQLLAYFSVFFVAKMLSVDDIGRIKIMQSYTNILLVVSGMGLATSTLQLCATTKDKSAIKQYFGSAFWITLLGGVVVYLFLFTAIQFNLISPDSKLENYFYFYGLALLPLSLNSLFTAYLQAIKNFKLISSLQISTKVVSIVAVIVCTYFFGVLGFIYATVGSFAFTSIVFYFKIGGVQLRKPNLSVHWPIAVPSIFANLLGSLLIYMDIIILNYLIRDTAIKGQYGFALNFVMALLLITATAQQYATPVLASLTSDIGKWKEKLRYFQKLMLYGSFVFSLLSMAAVPIFITLFFETKFGPSIWFFEILVLGWFFKNLYSLRGAAVIGLGMVSYNVYALLFALIPCFITTYLLTQAYGAIGSAISFAICHVYIFISTQVTTNLAIKKFWK